MFCWDDVKLYIGFLPFERCSEAETRSMNGADIFVQHRIEYIQEYGITPPSPNGTPSSANSSNAEGMRSLLNDLSLYQVHLNSIGRPSIAHLHILHLRF